MRRVASLLLAWAAAACGGSNELEVIYAVPEHVISVDELAFRVERSYYEPAAQLEGLRVVGIVVRRPRFCDPEKGAWTCPKGVEARFLFADPGGQPVAVEILGEGDKLEEGKRYVLWGSAEMAPDVPQRWVLRAKVLARVDAPEQ